ncbi:membrane protein [Acetobacter cibinongensis]|uniref:Membrane protein n=1 Tax=Acetobacter cibinongensis TaxID=146475 RepID=A0A0D6N4P2_9PROT|nr:SPFH domain-containing protein [Acetobacter cibinongensis]GAN60680.1 hypothetical protein Abci_016_026 [Acetobacter cibinongensis]GBQ11853.1 hypothetical protein AA0482_0064 [Acetobacter cibinongensis NRIC 0482]GEL58711.1 membrane protein [Acetobacter cibinongensis]
MTSPPLPSSPAYPEKSENTGQKIVEHTLRPVSAWVALGGCVGLGLIAAFCLTLSAAQFSPAMTALGPVIGFLCLIVAALLLKGLIILQPNQAAVCLFFGSYKGTLTQSGFWWLNPFYSCNKVSLRLKTEECGPLKVNDAVGNPVEIGAVIIWRVSQAARALLDVENYSGYVSAQSETTLRLLASQYPYDPTEQQNAVDHAPEHPIHTGLTLRDGSDTLASLLLKELKQRMAPVGIDVVDARISHLAYAPEIASAMLRKQAASAVISARRIITEGAVAIIDDALSNLESRMGHELPPEQRAAMISNLLVVLIGDREATPTLNTGL